MLNDTPVAPRVSRRQPKRETVVARLEEMARDYGPETKLPTVNALKEQLGCSLGTLTAALDDLEARGPIRRVQGGGIFVTQQVCPRIAVICDPSFFYGAGHSEFWDLLLEHALERAAQKGESLHTHFSNPAATAAAPLQEALMQEICSGMVQGILLLGVQATVVEWLKERGVPFVGFATPSPYTVEVENVVEKGVEELAKLGCRRIGYWTPVAGAARDRKGRNLMVSSVAWSAALTRRGLSVDPKHFQYLTTALDASGSALPSLKEQGYYVALSVFEDEYPLPDGILIDNDMMAQGALTAFLRLGVRVGTGPEDLKIATTSNLGSSTLLGHEEGLVRLQANPQDIVHRMFDMLETLMEGKTPAARNQSLPVTVMLPETGQNSGGRL